MEDAETCPETKKLLRRASSIVSDDQPYMRVQRQGSIFTPVEAGHSGECADAEAEADVDPDAEREQLALMLEETDPVSPQKEVARKESANFTYGTSSGKEKNPLLVLHVQVLADNYNNPKHCLPNGQLKPRRPVPHIRASDLLSGLTNVNGEWIFEAELNGWPAYRNYALKSLTSVSDYKVMKRVNRLWRAEDGKALPQAKDLPAETRATFLAPSWAAQGWAPDSPGFFFWYSTQHGSPRCLIGEAMFEVLEADSHSKAVALTAHTFAHRYPVAKESMEDRATYHVGVFLEWSHGQYGTVAELAWRNGCGGYGGRANWIPDKLEPETELFKAMPPGLKQPWSNKFAEVRCYDLPYKTKAEFEGYLKEYSEKSSKPLAEQRFLEPRVYASAPIRLRRLTATSLAEYIVNYIERVPEYGKLTANCQSFGADLYAFLTGSKDVEPFHAISKVGYKQRTRSFLYVPRGDEP